MKRMMLFTSILVLAAGCATNNQTSEQARTYQNGYAVTTGPKGKEAATMTAPIITDMQMPPGTAVTTTYPYYVPSIGPKGKEAAAMTLPINPGINSVHNDTPALPEPRWSQYPDRKQRSVELRRERKGRKWSFQLCRSNGFDPCFDLKFLFPWEADGVYSLAHV